MKTAPPAHTFASPKVAQRIARRTGQQPRAVTVRMVGRKDVTKLVTGILQAQKSSRRVAMVLD
jgi:hypothetical protein